MVSEVTINNINKSVNYHRTVIGGEPVVCFLCAPHEAFLPLLSNLARAKQVSRAFFVERFNVQPDRTKRSTAAIT